MEVKKEQVDLSNFDKRAVPALLVFIVFVVIGLSYFFYLKRSREEKYNNEKITVTTSIFPIYDIARNIIGENEEIDLSYVVPVSVNLQLYEPPDTDKDKIRDSDLSFFVGAGYDDSLGSFAVDSKVDLSSFIELKEGAHEKVITDYKKICSDNSGTWLSDYNECVNSSEELCASHSGKYDSCASACRHEANEEQCIAVCVAVCTFDSSTNETTKKTSNPYYWLSIENAKTIAQVVYKEIAKKKPQYSYEFAQNYESYIQSLDEARSYIDEQSKLIDDKRVLVLTDSSDYFLMDYGFQVVNRLENKDLAEVKKSADKYNSRLYLKDEFYSNEEITGFLEDQGAQIVAVKTVGGEGQELNYIDLVRTNIDRIYSTYESLGDYRFVGKDYVGEFNLKNTKASIFKKNSLIADLSLSELPESLGTVMTNFYWIDKDKFALETHVNPSYGELYFYEVENENLIYLKRYLGSQFTLSPSGEKVAYIGYIAHFSDFGPQEISFMVNDRVLYKRKGEQFPSEIELYSNISWSDVSTVQFRDWSNDGDLKVVVAE
ncbi:MAG: metal ABC transporter substrate-binding protein [Patescibacteria group bacterium]|nr:metal ABC transporter substrate-binding protein [Patescibacteria group bacterium]